MAGKTPRKLKCGEVDPPTGARCSLEKGHFLPHRDISDQDFEIQFHGPLPELVVPEFRTETR